MLPTFETARLILRPLELADAKQTQQLFPHWEIVRYLAKGSVPWPYPADGAHTYYRDLALPAMARGEEWHWSIRVKEAPEQIIGSIALMKGENNRGFWIAQPWQGRGYISEAVEPVTDYWFNELKFSVMRIPKAAENIPSRRISEKTGMRLVLTKESDYVSGRLPAEIWEITAEEWNRRKRK